MKKTKKRILSISLWNCPLCPDCPVFSKYIRNLNSWRKVLKSGTKGTIGTNQTIFGILTAFGGATLTINGARSAASAVIFKLFKLFISLNILL